MFWFQKIAAHLCEECGKGFKSSSNLAQHMRWHTEPTIECPDCPKKFHLPSKLERHAVKHRNVTYVCEICHCELQSRSGYERHLRMCFFFFKLHLDVVTYDQLVKTYLLYFRATHQNRS